MLKVDKMGKSGHTNTFNGCKIYVEVPAVALSLFHRHSPMSALYVLRYRTCLRKVVHLSLKEAWKHARRLGGKERPYRCPFERRDITAKEHWHVGRPGKCHIIRRKVKDRCLHSHRLACKRARPKCMCNHGARGVRVA